MSDTNLTPGAQPPPATPLGYTTQVAGSSLPAAGTPVYKNSSAVVLPAKADADATASCIGLTLRPAADAAGCVVYYSGVLVLSVAEWNALETGATTGLTPNATYYLSDASAGKITRTAPTTEGHRVAPLGISLSATDFLILLSGGTDHA